MLIGKMFLKTKYVSLVNLVLGRECVRELLQHHMTMANATAELEAILPGGAKHERIKTDYAELRSADRPQRGVGPCRERGWSNCSKSDKK